MRWFVGWDADRVQAALNVFGGAAFVLGSVLFMVPHGFGPGIALFLLGSVGMFAGSMAVWRERYAVRAARAGASVRAAPQPPEARDPAEAGQARDVVAPAGAGITADAGFATDAGFHLDAVFAFEAADAGLTSPATPGR